MNGAYIDGGITQAITKHSDHCTPLKRLLELSEKSSAKAVIEQPRCWALQSLSVEVLFNIALN